MSRVLQKFVHTGKWLKTQETLKSLKVVTGQLNETAQKNYDLWSSPSQPSHLQHGADRIVHKIMTRLGKDTEERKARIRKDVAAAAWLLGRQQVNVLSPMDEAVHDLENPLPLLVVQHRFATDMLEILNGRKYDPRWEEALTGMLTTFPGYNVVAAGKNLHVDYDFKNALLYTKEQLGEVPSVKDWGESFAAVLAGLRQTKNEMNANLPVNIFHLGTSLPGSERLFFDWRNAPLEEFHGPGTVYPRPSQKQVDQLFGKTKFLPFKYAIPPQPAITYDPEGTLQKPGETDEEPKEK